MLPVAAVCALGPARGESAHRFAYADEPWAAVHIAVALVAYALFVVAALQALVLTGLEKRLHRGLPAGPSGSAPPLLTLERFLFRLVGVGFVLLTLTLASGFLFSEEMFGKPVTFTHKNVFSVAGWLTFADPAVRPLALRLARSPGAELDPRGHGVARPRLPRQQVRAGSRCFGR